MRARQSWWAAGLLAACAAAAAGCGQAVGSGNVTGTPAATAGTTTARATAPSGSAAAACRKAQLNVTVVKGGVATGHVGVTIGFRNTGRTPCTLRGWPTVTAVTAAGHRVVAHHTLTTFFGPVNLTAPPVVTVRPGGLAEAQLAGIDFPVHGGSCPPSYRILRIAPPGGGPARRLPAWVSGLGQYFPACGTITVSPVVRPSDLA